jgi:predicted PurR-regulated permease PerM
MEKKESIRVAFSWQTLWKVFVFALLIAGAYMARDVLGIVFVAIVLSLALDPLVTFLETKKIKRLPGTIIIFLTGGLMIAIAAYLFIPVLTLEASGFLKHIHEITYTIFGIGLPDNILDALTFGRDKLFTALASADISIAGTLASLFTSIVFFVATFLISFYLCIEKEGVERLIRVILPDAYEGDVLKVFHRFKVKIRRWFAAQLILSIVVGVLVAVGLWLLGVRYSLRLGLLAMIFELVPVIGPIIVGTIAFLVAVSDSFILGVYALIFFVAVQQFENHILIPMIIGKTMNVHPVVVISSLLVGGKIAGFIGIILAVPIAVIAQETFDYLSEKKEKRRSARE